MSTDELINLAIITPCIRPANIPIMQLSVEPGSKIFNLRWIIVYDSNYMPPDLLKPNSYSFQLNYHNPKSVCGNFQRDKAIEILKNEKYNGWIKFLDDDNIIHYDYFNRIHEIIIGNPDAKAIVANQLRDATISHLIASPFNVRWGYIDTDQYTLHADIVNASFSETNTYSSDFDFIKKIFKSEPESFLFVNEYLSFYNALVKINFKQL